MNRDIRRNNFRPYTPRNLIVPLDKQTLPRPLCERNDNVFLALEHGADGRVLDLDHDGDLVFEGLAVGSEVVQTGDGPCGPDGRHGQFEVGVCFREVLGFGLRVRDHSAGMFDSTFGTFGDDKDWIKE